MTNDQLITYYISIVYLIWVQDLIGSTYTSEWGQWDSNLAGKWVSASCTRKETHSTRMIKQ